MRIELPSVIDTADLPRRVDNDLRDIVTVYLTKHDINAIIEDWYTFTSFSEKTTNLLREDSTYAPA